MHPACLFEYAKRQNLFSLKFGHAKNRFHYFMPRFSQSTTRDFQEIMKVKATAKRQVRNHVYNTLNSLYGKNIERDKLRKVANYAAMYRGEATQEDGISGRPKHESIESTLSRIRKMMKKFIENAELLKLEEDATCLREVQELLQSGMGTKPLEAIVVC